MIYYHQNFSPRKDLNRAINIYDQTRQKEKLKNEKLQKTTATKKKRKKVTAVQTFFNKL